MKVIPRNALLRLCNLYPTQLLDSVNKLMGCYHSEYLDPPHDDNLIRLH